MSPDFITYVKNSYKEFLLSLIFPFIIYFVVEDRSFIEGIIVLDILGFIPGYYKYKDRLLFQEKLKKRGLTGEDLNNIAFVKSWDEIRKKGVIKYSLIDGGIFFGFLLSIIISIALFIIKTGLMHYISSDPSNMFKFIGYSYLAGAMCGIVIFRITWVYNEQKFIRLTDPLH